MLALPITLAALATLFSTGSATCYWPTGNETYSRDATEHMRCSNDTTSPLHTICCALNRTNLSGGDIKDGRTNDVCLPNGICQNKVLNHGTLQVSYWRETCTEQDWKKGLCLDVCSDDWTSGNGTTGAIMTPCDGTAGSLRWCCGVDTSCCKDDKKVKLIPFEFRGAIPNTAAASSAPWPIATSPSSQGDDDGLSTGAKAGIGVSAGIGGLALVGLGFMLARRTAGRNARQEQPKVEETETRGPTPPEKTVYRYELEPGTRAELPYSPHDPHLAAAKAESAELP
ncbi:hypothetical protein K469DRAFT_609226 [Zopfia rhizophila CBS 207.26]|uniref:Uncharacterized protein n=1 Tax=Zopfia rhizophila CBS 207.26 TaxID=1314779 RepID=A0A6A6D9T6_9PEZI|nr:hypothetical protein K469DRAFT_609226 [Zopfia rhizophila CBS 207.26]